MSKCGPNCRRYTTLGIASFLLLIGILLAIFWSALFYSLLRHELVIKKNSPNYNMWKETPIPIYFKVYMFNWTNSDAVLAAKWKTTKPQFDECGPYVFYEHHIRTNAVWNDNNTITYQQKRIWHFVPEMSNGTLQDKITNVNPVAATIAFYLRSMPFYVKMMASVLINEKERSLVITKSVDELLYKGYDDQLLEVLIKAKIPNFKIPFKKFGWFYNRNGSETYDGTFTMYGGVSDIDKLGVFDRWNGLSKSSYYTGSCGAINGTSGELWPPVKGADKVAIFSPDICSNIDLKYNSTKTVHGIDGRMYVTDESLFDNGSKYPEKKCFNTGETVPSGTRNISSCRFGAPAFISNPHFLHADASYRNSIIGMRPDAQRHGFTVTLEPTTGIPLNVSAALQLNLYLQPISYITMFAKLPKIFIPMVWFRQTATLSDSYAEEVKVLLVLPHVISYTGFGLVTASFLLFVSYIFVTFHKGWRTNEEERLLPQ